MPRTRRCDRRGIALIAVLLLGFSSTRTAVAFEQDLLGPEQHAISAVGEDGAPESESTSIASQIPLALCAQTALAPRIGELRQPSAMRAAPRSLVVVSCEVPSSPREETGALCTGSGELTRWCLAHATSTQAP
jgi:hypothetical protein